MKSLTEKLQRGIKALGVREEDLTKRCHDALNSGEANLRQKYMDLIETRLKIKIEELK